MLNTTQLILRDWQDGDIPVFAAYNRDPRVMRYFPSIMTESESTAAIERYREGIKKNGYGFFAVEEKASGKGSALKSRRRTRYRGVPNLR